MPTERYGSVRRMLRDGLAVVVRCELFTIRLLYASTRFTQPVTLGVDESKLEKSHSVDARCISGNPLARPCGEMWRMRQVANHTRSLHLQNMMEGGKRKKAIAPHHIGKTKLQRYDKILWNEIRCFIAGSTNGRPILRNID